jgi:hypothetical protein
MMEAAMKEFKGYLRLAPNTPENEEIIIDVLVFAGESYD